MSQPEFPSVRKAGSCPALILNADYRPLSSFPLSVWSWQDAVHAVFQNRVIVVREHDSLARSQYLDIRKPSVVALKDYVKMHRVPAFTRYNLLLRDQWCCAYCGHSFSSHQLTLDHVIPRSRGGKTTWTNIVMCCNACNGAKGNRTPEEAKMPLQWRPWQPTGEDLARVGARFRTDKLPADWYEFLNWEQEAA